MSLPPKIRRSGYERCINRVWWGNGPNLDKIDKQLADDIRDLLDEHTTVLNERRLRLLRARAVPQPEALK